MLGLRGILRNVQYYLLFFSTLLVLLAFQRLRWFDQVFPHPYTLSDHPFPWRGHSGSGSSPDDAGRIFYGGDESREIGMFRFRLGLLKFALPMFSSPAGWERTSEISSRWMTVPPPPHRMKRRSNDGKAKNNLRLKVDKSGELSSGSDEEQRQRTQGQEATNSTVAYLVIIGSDSLQQNGQSLQESARALSNSIETAHLASSYDYQLYSIDLRGMQTEDDANANEPHRDHEQLSEFGFRTIKAAEGELRAKDKETSAKDTTEGLSLQTVFDEHDIVAQICIHSLMLKPMDDLFDALLGRKNAEDLIGVVDKRRGDKGEGMSDEKKNEAERQSTLLVDSFVLESMEAHSARSFAENELVIFRSKSEQAAESYLKSLDCISERKMGELPLQTQPQNTTSVKPRLRLSMVARKNKEISRSASPACTLQVENSLQLDRCVYDGAIDDIGRDCSHVNFKEDARVAKFPGPSSLPGDIVTSTELGAGAKAKDSDEASGYCTKILRCPGGDCPGKSRLRDEMANCRWLYGKWASFVGRSNQTSSKQ